MNKKYFKQNQIFYLKNSKNKQKQVKIVNNQRNKKNQSKIHKIKINFFIV